jgi:hypothetical protein
MLTELRGTGYAVTDLLHASHLPHPFCHPVTYADADDTGRPRDVVLTAVEDQASSMCLDYMFLLEPARSPVPAPASLESSADAMMHGACEDVQVGGMAVGRSIRATECVVEARVEPFFVHEARQPFAQLSDHYGVSALLTLPPRAEPALST